MVTEGWHKHVAALGFAVDAIEDGRQEIVGVVARGRGVFKERRIVAILRALSFITVAGSAVCRVEQAALG